MDIGMQYMNRFDNKPYVVKEQLPEGSFVMEDPNSQEQYYVTQQDLDQQDMWLPKKTEDTNSFNVAVAAAMNINKKDIQRLRERAVTYFSQWSGKLPTTKIISNFIKSEGVSEELVGEVYDALKGISTTATMTFPVMLHIAVDSPSKAIKTLLDEPDICMALAFSKHTGYDLMAIGYPKPIRQVLREGGIYVDSMKTAPLPTEYRHSFTKNALQKLNVTASTTEIQMVDTYINYLGMPALTSNALIEGWVDHKDNYSLSDWLRVDSATKFAELDKEFPMQTINDYDMKNGETVSEQDYYVGVDGSIIPNTKNVGIIS